MGTMDWTPGGLSDDVEDRRGDSGGGGGGFGFGGGGGGGLGIIGVVVLVIVSLVTGHNYIGSYLSGGGGGQAQAPSQRNSQYGPTQRPASPASQSPGEDRSAQLVSFVLGDAQKFWAQTLQEQGIQYRRAKVVLYRNATYSGCGTAQSQVGPFYCPADQKIYMDLSFWDELAKLGGGHAEFAQAYVVAHELGHHIQNVLGTEQKVERANQQNPSGRNRLSVKVELQADCFAGIWAKSGENRGFIHTDDIAGGLKAAAAVGDDHLQGMQGGTVRPDTFTHGSSADREKWFNRGLNGGTIDSCNTFSADAN
jgi:predicted metalloprotease